MEEVAEEQKESTRVTNKEYILEKAQEILKIAEEGGVHQAVFILQKSDGTITTIQCTDSALSLVGLVGLTNHKILESFS